jgi:hypothetical protein
MNLTFDDMYGWFEAWIGVIFLIFLGALMFFITQKVYFWQFMRVYVRWLNNVSGVYLVQVSLLLIGPQGLGHFFRCRPKLPIGWRQCCGSLTFWYGSGSADPCLWPDPAIFVLDLQDANNDKYSTNHSKWNTSSKLIHFIHCTIILVISGHVKNKQLTLLANANLLLLE